MRVDVFEPVPVLSKDLFEDVPVLRRCCNHEGAPSGGIGMLVVQLLYHVSPTQSTPSSTCTEARSPPSLTLEPRGRQTSCKMQIPIRSRNADALCEVIFHPIDPRATPLLRGRHPRHSLQEARRTARQACAMAFRNNQEQRGKYLTLELSSTRNPVEDMYAIVSKFQSAKIGA